MSELIRILIVDDHPIVRDGLSALVEANDDFELAGEAAGGAEAVRRAMECRPAVVLMDMLMPGMDGVEATRAIRQLCPDTQVIALTSFGDDCLVQRALRAGAISYLLKNASHLQLAEAIRAAAAGRPTLAPEATQALIQAALGPPAPGNDLTPREREVLALMVDGKSNAEIAECLVVSPSTAKSHVGNILSKLGVAGRTEAVAVALKQGLVDGLRRGAGDQAVR
jgi:NarL family two-component system response regulator LiaR